MIVKCVNDLSLDEVDRIGAVDLKGLFVATQEAGRHRGEGGRIINIGSIDSDHSELKYRSGYRCRWGPEYCVGNPCHKSIHGPVMASTATRLGTVCASGKE